MTAMPAPLPTRPQRVRHLPDWETPVRRPKDAPLVSRLALCRNPPPVRTHGVAAGAALSGKVEKAVNQVDGAEMTTPQPRSLPTRLRTALGIPSRQDRTSAAGRRRVLVLYTLGLVVFTVALALGLGLGFGLRRRARGPWTFTGTLTYFDPGLGACGERSTAKDLVCAVGHDLFDAAAAKGATNPNANPICGRRIRLTRADAAVGLGNTTVDVTVVDRCTKCGPEDLDLSPAVFERLVPGTVGRRIGSWYWLD